MLKISEKAILELGKIPHLMLLVGVAIESGRVVLDQVAESALNEMGSKRRIFTEKIVLSSKYQNIFKNQTNPKQHFYTNNYF